MTDLNFLNRLLPTSAPTSKMATLSRVASPSKPSSRTRDKPTPVSRPSRRGRPRRQLDTRTPASPSPWSKGRAISSRAG